MCGIFGIIYSGNRTKNVVKSDIRKLFLLTEPRGKQASGLAVLKKNNVNIYKRPITASKMVKHPDYLVFMDKVVSSNSSSDNMAFIAHCRLTTDGTELDNNNNQPLNTESIIGVHNGVVNNHYELSSKYSIKREGKSDTEILLKFLEERFSKDKKPYKTLESLFKEMKGAASLALLYKNHSLLALATNTGSLYYTYLKNNFFLFASEEKIIIDFLKSKKLTSNIKQLKPTSILFIDIKNFSICKGMETLNLYETPSIKIIDHTSLPFNIKKCSKCILPVNYPFLKLDKNGVCNFCNKYEKQEFKGVDKLHQFFDKYRSKNGEVDCLIGLSGGRDSSFGLHLLKKEFGMNPVGFCYDWLLTSKKARHNIAKMSGALGVEVIYRCGDYETQAKNIRNNINGFLKDPNLGMLTFVQAGDKEMYHFGRKIRKEKNLKLTVWCSGYQLEQREFFLGYCGINKKLINNPRLYDYGWGTKLKMAIFYSLKTLKNPYWWNRSIYDNALAFWHCFIGRDDFLYLYNYYPWKQDEVERVLNEQYGWEADSVYGTNQWRMDDFHTSFINHVYYTIGGFSEFDEYRSNQIREGLISRSEALELAHKDNIMRYESLREFAALVGFNLEHVLKKIDSIPKLY